jgi:1-acyl-sn-glycerol-3-phosphate acyltransferase
MKFNPIFHGFIRRLYYGRITVTGAEHVPSSGPLLVLCLHRNGAVDGFVYRAAVPRLTYLIRAKLRKNLIGKLFFSGVEVVRSEDGGSPADNLAMIDTCVRHLQSDEPLAIFPEGTSKLGPRHLPFKSGAARISLSHLETGRPLTVLPLGIHYECPWAFRSRVEVVVGEAIHLEASELPASRGARLRDLKERFTTALEAVGSSAPDARTFDLAQKLAYIATLGTGLRYFEALKSMEQSLPAKAVQAWKRREIVTWDKLVLRHQGVPLFPMGPAWVYALLALLLAVPVLGGARLNLPPLAVGYFSARRFADDTNVIAQWRILTGVPCFVLWAVACVLTAALLGHGWMALGYLGLTWIAVRGWYRLKKLTVAASNGLLHSDLRDEALALRRTLLAELP